MEDGVYKIRRMKREEVGIAIEWAEQEGWNPGLHDGKCFYSTDPEGFFIGLLDDRPISCISAVAYDDKFGFMGFYIVKPEYRGKGYGLKIWQVAMDYLGSRNIGLDGVVAQQGNYKKSGFRLAYRNIRFQFRNNIRVSFSPYIKTLNGIPFDKIIQYDRTVFPAVREKFLEGWINQPDGFAAGYLKSGRLGGYGVIRKCRVGYKIGPLFADDISIADELLQTLMGNVGKKTDDPVFLDVPEINREALDLAAKYQMKKVFETARMYTKEKPQLDFRRIFGVTTFELG